MPRLLPVTLLALSLMAARAENLTPELRVEAIAEHTWVAVHSYPWAANAVVAEMPGREVLLIDTPYTPEATELLLDWITRTLRPKKITAVNTHYHVDRLGGNAALLRRGIDVYGSDHSVRLLAEHGEQAREQLVSWTTTPALKERYRRFEWVAPNHIFAEKEGLTLQLGGERVRVLYPGAAHSPDNLAVYLPRRKLLAAGCAVIGNPTIGNVAEADLEGWSAAIEVMKKLKPSIVVPGHGGEGRFNAELLEHTARLVAAARAKPVGR